MWPFRRSARSESRRKTKRAIQEVFKSRRANAFGTHGTLSSRLASIKATGLHSLEMVTFYRIREEDLLKELKHGGRTGVYRYILSLMDGNLSYSESKYKRKWDGKGREPATPFEELSIVVVKVGWRKWVREDIPPKNILLTITLSPADIQTLNKNFPETPGFIPGQVFAAEEDDFVALNANRKKVLYEIARIFARKVIRGLSAKS